MKNIQAEKNKLRRLRVLQTLNYARPETLGDGLIRRVLGEESDLSLGLEETRKALDYLCERNLCEIVKRSEDVWISKISADGVDYLDGLGNDLAGVARPQDY